jgi:hypothetical protein
MKDKQTAEKIAQIEKYFDRTLTPTAAGYQQLLHYIGLVPGLSKGIYGLEAMFQNASRSDFGIYQTPIQFAGYLKWLEEHISGIRSYLEIGVFSGGMAVVMKNFINCFAGENLRTVWLEVNLANIHPAAVQYLGDQLRICSSFDRGFIAEAQAAPFDMVFIDGDHEYKGVRADWENFGRTARIVVFHDIVEKFCPGVVRLWNELNTLPGWQSVTFVDSVGGHVGQGIGVLYKD